MEERSSSTRRARPTDEFIQLVFSWSLEDIFNEDLYRNQVEKIPELHQSVDLYLGSYVYPLLEETRAELASAMDGIYNAPFAEVIALHVAKPYDTHTLLYDVKVEKWKNRSGHGDREPYRTLPGDVVLLLNGKPESVADLQQFGWTWTFASVTNIAEVENDDTYPSTYFKVKAKRRIEVEDGQHKSLYVVFLANITTNRRIWNALCMRQNLNIIQTVLSKNDRVSYNSNLNVDSSYGGSIYLELLLGFLRIEPTFFYQLSLLQFFIFSSYFLLPFICLSLMACIDQRCRLYD
ncbi:Hypothetical predicted protein [Olea europaea subsp. europaea]|uniref:DUF6469 domain-containing protein n=1 Tax=Olea europaea subsp. europaea TaxID=158383 RepID=A0A8S0V0T3_OLEEU|nr:Hypothetical predicted protein [Olea europaea subsp. europaea]